MDLGKILIVIICQVLVDELMVTSENYPNGTSVLTNHIFQVDSNNTHDVRGNYVVNFISCNSVQL